MSSRILWRTKTTVYSTKNTRYKNKYKQIYIFYNISNDNINFTLINNRFKEPKPECTTDSECSNDKACINYSCKNPCQESPTTCAGNALCYVQKHRSVCVCRDGMTGNAQIQCVESKF